MPHVYSTLANSQYYTNYLKANTADNPNDLPKVIAGVHINGGAGLSSKHLITPLGVHTKVSDEELEILEANSDFQLHKKNGYIKVQKDKSSVEAAVSDMELRDKSAPKVPQDYEDAEETEDDQKTAKPMTQAKKGAVGKR